MTPGRPVEVHLRGAAIRSGDLASFAPRGNCTEDGAPAPRWPPRVPVRPTAGGGLISYRFSPNASGAYELCYRRAGLIDSVAQAGVVMSVGQNGIDLVTAIDPEATKACRWRRGEAAPATSPSPDPSLGASWRAVRTHAPPPSQTVAPGRRAQKCASKRTLSTYGMGMCFRCARSERRAWRRPSLCVFHQRGAGGRPRIVRPTERHHRPAAMSR